MWGKGGGALEGPELVWVNINHSTLRVDGANVGHVRIKAPAGASVYSVSAAGPPVNVTGPLLGIDTGRRL